MHQNNDTWVHTCARAFCNSFQSAPSLIYSASLGKQETQNKPTNVKKYDTAKNETKTTIRKFAASKRELAQQHTEQIQIRNFSSVSPGQLCSIYRWNSTQHVAKSTKVAQENNQQLAILESWHQTHTQKKRAHITWETVQLTWQQIGRKQKRQENKEAKGGRGESKINSYWCRALHLSGTHWKPHLLNAANTKKHSVQYKSRNRTQKSFRN